jgi:ADP-ribosylglycohydrolase
MEGYSLLNMNPKQTILILEDNEAREAAIRHAIGQIGPDFVVIVWCDAYAMCAECEAFFPEAVLISLDHDLTPRPGANPDAGTGMDVARFLGDHMPACPVIVHSQNTEMVWSMHNELRFAGWTVEQAGGMGTDWSEANWARSAGELLKQSKNTWKVNLPDDHAARVERMQLSLDGLGLGDALGEMLSYRSENALRRLSENDVPAGPWFHTDDTEMAISIVAVLKSHGELVQDALARRFARRFERDPDRGYGKMTRIQLREINAGAKWREMAANAFGGQGSMGNGGAMRVAPLGAYFADDLAQCTDAARASALVTHTHPEGVAGTIAVAVAAAMAWQLRGMSSAEYALKFFVEVLRYVPESKVRRGLLLASQTPVNVPVEAVAKAMGNGSLVTAPDTVPLCLWMAAHHPRNFVEALGKTISAGGDCDTNAAIVGGIVALGAGREGIPTEWLSAREKVAV